MLLLYQCLYEGQTMQIKYSHLKHVDKEIFDAIKKETNRQKNTIELIASENFVSRSVLEAVGSLLTNKYAEGYPSKRYYGGCEHVDTVENLAINRAKKLFNAEHANVQPHSGANANFAVYFALLSHGDTVLGMNLSHGGHLTHGSPVNVSGKYFKFIDYGVDRVTETINYEEVERIAIETKPKMIVAGASAYPRIIDFKKFREIADKVGAILMVDMAHIAGLVVAGAHPSPVPFADVVTSTTHKTLRGPRGGLILCKEKYAKIIDKAIFPGTQGGPLEHIIAGKAVAFHEAMQEKFITYQKQVVANAKKMAETFINNGIKLVSNGTDNHLMLLDLSNTGINGKQLESILEKVGITVNKNTIPFDKLQPNITSGIRIGTPSVTTRGMKEEQMQIIANLIIRVIKEKESCFSEVKKEVDKIITKYPLPY